VLILVAMLLVPVLVVVGVAVWLLAPTLRTFRGPAFEPASKDDQSVLDAQQNQVISGY
jgi:hypothetical protein